MANRLKTLFFILVLSIGVFSGTPVQGGEMMMKDVCPMKCCKKSVKSNKPKKTDSKFLCRVLVCSQSMPTNTASAPQINLAPVIIASDKLTLREILFATTPKEIAQLLAFHTQELEDSQPKYIRHQKILV